MRIIDDTFIIGIDSGYGNIKTANCCFPASVAAYDTEPVFKDNMLVYGNRFYLIGEGHKEFLADKTRDSDYYVLALAAIAREMNIKKLTTGRIRIAAGLPLTWVSGQRDDFKNYLLQNRSVEFSFRNTNYSIEVVGVDVFPQGFAAVADRLSDFKGISGAIIPAPSRAILANFGAPAKACEARFCGEEEKVWRSSRQSCLQDRPMNCRTFDEATRIGLEPTTPSVTGWCSNQLSYRATWWKLTGSNR